MKQLILKIEKNRIRLDLISGGKAVGRLEWKENNNLSRTLLGKIDEILKKNKVGVDKISRFEIISDVPPKWTSARIAKITFESLKIAGPSKISLRENLGG